MKALKLCYALIILLTASCSAQTPEAVSPDDFAQKIKDVPNATLLDVRTPDEYAAGHIGKAINIDWLNDGFTDKVQKLDKSKPVLIYCLSGARSHKAAVKMRDMGFQVTELQGGIRAWTDSGHDVQK